jgi:hypothetical protein
MPELEPIADTSNGNGRIKEETESQRAPSGARQRLSVLRLKGGAALGEPADAAFSLPLRAGVPIASPEAQLLIFESLCASRAAGSVLDPATLLPIGRVQLAEDGTLLTETALAGQRLLVQVGSHYAAYRFFWELPSGFLCNSLETFAERHTRRAGVSSRVRVQYQGAGAWDGSADAAVVDVSTGGLSFLLDADSELPKPGDVFQDCVVSWRRGSSLRLEAQVAHVTRQGAKVRVGVRLSGEAAVVDEWRVLIEELLFADTSRGKADSELLWSAYAASGYLQLGGKDSESFGGQQPAFRRAQALLAQAPQVGAIFSAGRVDCPEAYVHQMQGWPRAWLLLHLCRRREGRTLRTSDDSILLSLYDHCYGFILAHEAEWLVTYTHAGDTAFSHRVHCEYAGTLAPELGCVLPFEAVEVSGVSGELAEDASVSPARSGDLVVIRHALVEQLPAPYLQAMGLSDDDLGLGSMGRLWAGSGLARSRQILVARRRGRVVAAAILDLASAGLHLYGLLDKVRLVAVEAGGRDYFNALLRVSYSCFAAAGHSRFVYFRDVDAPALSEQVVSSSMGNAHINVIGRQSAAGFLQRVFLLLSRTLNHSKSYAPGSSLALPGETSAQLSWEKSSRYVRTGS